MEPVYTADSTLSFDETCIQLEKAIASVSFGVQSTHNLGETLRAKGQDFNEECKVFEVCNPAKASQVLHVGMILAVMLPCRIAVWTDKNKSECKVGMLRPSSQLGIYRENVKLHEIADDVEKALIQAIDNSLAYPA